MARARREQAPPYYFMMEQYGPDGEIEEAWEGHPFPSDGEGVQMVVITGHGFAKPRTDWRKRGIIPPKGYHKSKWRKEELPEG